MQWHAVEMVLVANFIFRYSIHSFQMTVKNLQTWRIETTQPFYPVGITCIGNDANSRALIVFAAHNVNTFIFRKFLDDIKHNRPAHKSHLHKSFFPDRIKDVLVGTNESAILFENGSIKRFTSTKTLKTVPYLSCVKTICATRNGFVLIKTSGDGSEFFVEFISDSFEEDNEQSRKKFNISFEKVVELQSTWNRSMFIIKELAVNQNTIVKMAANADDAVVALGSIDCSLFLSIDNNFCYLVCNEECIVNVLSISPAKIVNFWSSRDGNYILLFLQSGTIEILYLDSEQGGVNKECIYCGNGIRTYYFFDDKFFFSNGVYVECIMFGMQSGEQFNRQCFSLPGIVALTFVPELQVVLCVSENCCFYSIAIKDKDLCVGEWFEINSDRQTQISNLKYDVIELSEAYAALLDKQQQQRQAHRAIKLNQCEERAEKNYHFVGYCSVTQRPPTPPPDDSFIYIPNSLVHDRASSFFVCISISYTTKYANEFDANFWRLYCIWLNDKHEYVYANIKLKRGHLFAQSPLTLIIHLNQKHLPNFHIDLSCVGSGSSLVHINFPVKVKQPNYCDIMHISKPTQIDRALINTSDIIYTVSALGSMSTAKIIGKE